MQTPLFRALSMGAVCVSAAAGSSAQMSPKHAVSPAGFAHVSGNTNNTYPFSGVSARYQQIHDAVDMQAITGSPTLIMNGMAFRPSNVFTIPARRWDVQITLGHTSVPASQMTTTFANNFTTTPTTVLPYTTINGPSGKGLGKAKPNDVLFVFPFKTLFTYVAPLGNLCWEWQHKNAGTRTSSPMDAASGGTPGTTVNVGANYGRGCTASGQGSPATCSHTIGGGTINLALANGRARSPALLWMGFQQAEFALPGWCTPLYVSPLASVSGMTDASGAWNSGTGPSSLLNVTPYAEVYTQYAFLDASLGGGVGLSDRGVLCAPTHGAQYVSRMWSLSSSNGNESATTGNVGRNYGLIVHFAIL